MNDEDKYRLATCFHCGNRGLMKIEHIYSQDYGGMITDEFGNVLSMDLEEHFDWILLSCPVCRKVTLLEDHNDECTRDFYTSTETLYPESKIDYEGVPANIKSSFESALKVKNIDSAICSIALRAVLEAICKERGAKGKTLEAMIRDLIQKNLLPAMFDDACWIVRQLGNKAAHGDDVQFSSKQVDQTILFMQNIINYLYTLPIKMNKLRDEISEEQIRKREKLEKAQEKENGKI